MEKCILAFRDQTDFFDMTSSFIVSVRRPSKDSNDVVSISSMETIALCDNVKLEDNCPCG
ncbi:hypothetical protein SLEP1_g27034 [Rubroshorea leprosula]|uniref:Uncharacterized protein n=1 Tax=Rubroshorea leprosula TaxID=152421 RepID=A0AAV5JYU9_9ROSI|nr:hypothetical protein SLEP1_g27034 [Rubroshorea leprosula]